MLRVKQDNHTGTRPVARWFRNLAVLISVALGWSCIKEDISRCPVPHYFDYDWVNQVESDACRGQVHLRLYHESGNCYPYDTPREGTALMLAQGRYEVLTFNDRMQGLTYSGLESSRTATATVQDVATPELVTRIEALRQQQAQAARVWTKADNPLIGQAEGFLYWDSIPQTTVEFAYEKHDTLIPETIGYVLNFHCRFTNLSMEDADSMEVTLSGIVPEVYMLEGQSTGQASRTALCETTRESDGFLATLYVFGFNPDDEYVFEGYIEQTNPELPPIYVDRDLTTIIKDAVNKAEIDGNPVIDFELELEVTDDGHTPESGELTTGTVTVVGWDEIDAGEM